MACHTRSNSFTSRPHPIVQEVDEHLCRLRSSEATSTSSSSISHKLSGLQDLHGSRRVVSNSPSFCTKK
ncbi:unnamed protein product [Prunus armeniaca]